MEKGLTATRHIMINAGREEVWHALTDPDMIRQYLFGTHVVSDWKEGSSITYEGNWEGKTYKDKGVIKKLIPGEILQSTYWSSMSGTADSPENYARVTYALEEEEGGTKLTISQDNCKTEESRKHSEQNWGMVLDSIKKLLEQ